MKKNIVVFLILIVISISNISAEVYYFMTDLDGRQYTEAKPLVVSSNDTFIVQIMVNTQEESGNVASALIEYDTEYLSLEYVTANWCFEGYHTSGTGLWDEGYCNISNPGGAFSIDNIGGTFYVECKNGAAAQINSPISEDTMLTLYFSTKKEGSATIAFSDVRNRGGKTTGLKFTAFQSAGQHLIDKVSPMYVQIGAPSYAPPAEFTVYPNPYVPGNIGQGNNSNTPGSGITFHYIPANSSIKIYTVKGQLVRKGYYNGINLGDYIWDTKNDDGKYIASGWYLYLIEGSGIKKTGRIAIIR